MLKIQKSFPTGETPQKNVTCRICILFWIDSSFLA